MLPFSEKEYSDFKKMEDLLYKKKVWDIFYYWNSYESRKKSFAIVVGIWLCFPFIVLFAFFLSMIGTTVSFTVLAGIGNALLIFTFVCVGFALFVSYLEKRNEDIEYKSTHSQF
jgi:hypothetical protein